MVVMGWVGGGDSKYLGISCNKKTKNKNDAYAFKGLGSMPDQTSYLASLFPSASLYLLSSFFFS